MCVSFKGEVEFRVWDLGLFKEFRVQGAGRRSAKMSRSVEGI